MVSSRVSRRLSLSLTPVSKTLSESRICSRRKSKGSRFVASSVNSVHTKTFKRLVGDLGSLADQVTIHQKENGLEFVASGPFTEQRVSLPQGEFLAFMNDDLTGPAGPYSLRVISLFAKAADNDLVRLKAKPGLPLVFEYTTALGGILFATSPVA